MEGESRRVAEKKDSDSQRQEESACRDVIKSIGLPKVSNKRRNSFDRNAFYVTKFGLSLIRSAFILSILKRRF